MNNEQSVIWRRLDTPGHESARVYGDDAGWYLDGAAVFLYDGQPCRLEYLVECDSDWQTAFVSVDGWVGETPVEIEIYTTQGDVWHLNDEEVAAVEGCIDIDLNFSPVTNLLPLRRLNLAIGESKTLRAAWLRFPSFELESLDQIYTRIDNATIGYESGGGRFAAELKVNEFGLVTEYRDY